MFTLVPMATAPPSPERLELGPGVFWLRFESFAPPCLPRARSDFTERGAEELRSADVGGEKESEEARGGEERRDKKSRGGQALGWGGGRKAKSITSLLEPSQKGKDMSQCTDCTSLSLTGWGPIPLCV